MASTPYTAEPDSFHIPAPSPSLGHDSFTTAEGLAADTSTSTAGASGIDGVRRRAPAARGVTIEQGASGDGVVAAASRRNTDRSNRSRSKHSVDPNAPLLKRMTTGLFTPEKPVGKAPGWLSSIRTVFFNSWFNILLVFIPVGWALHFVKANGNSSISDTVVFIMTFISIMPLAGLLGFATEEISMRVGQTIGGLINATLGNVVELIVAIIALVKCEIAVVQSSLIGSILSNLLLVLGCCFIAGGFKFSEQTMKSTAAQLNSSLLLISVVAVLIPSAFHFAIGSDNTSKDLTEAEEARDLLSMSHGVAVILLFLYLCFLVFQMWSHAHLYDDDDVSTSVRYSDNIRNMPSRVKDNVRDKVRNIRHRNDSVDEESAVESNAEPKDLVADGENVSNNQSNNGEEEEEEEEEVPQLNLPVTIITLVVVAVLVGVTAEFLVDSINGMVESNPSLSAEWVGLVLLPIVGNAAEHFTAVSVSVKDKLDLSVSVAVGSSIQVALFCIPFVELIAWWIGKPMTLLFDPFESLVLFFSVIVVNQTLADGRANWMEGVVLVLLYLIIAISFWYYPGTSSIIACT